MSVFLPVGILQPDAMVFRAWLSAKKPGPVDRVPDICVEVLSFNRAYDRVTKRFVYGAAGVKELWLVDPGGFIERWAGAGLSRDGIVKKRLTSPLLPAFALDVPRLFADLP